MECNRGSVCKESDHQVKTLEKAVEWFYGVELEHLPIRVNQVTAHNGRVQITIFDCDGVPIHKRW
ncbi:MAG: hypothetical protein COA94_05215 [Rickettsiales bacterium]|nr:MAG: hypothetical protein COA94_05215 [Rickettsiales bacterium]